MSRSIFEEVGEDQPTQPAAKPGAADALKRRNRKSIAIWLMILATLVIVQVLVGGATRLTESGLSMVEWSPQGALPPLSEAEWAAEFAKYQTTTEFIEVNYDMTLNEFKSIFWWEWGHRMWGRLIGLAFMLPFAYFLLRKMVPTGWTGRLVFVGALGAAQGVIGWWMVVSGLAGRVDVSQYRLAVHLGLAFLILGMLFWFALSLRREEWDLLQARRRREKGLFALGGALTGVLFLQIIIGAFVAGLKAWGYNDWPTMGGAFYPPSEPFAPFEEGPATQFLHRMFGYAALVLAIVLIWCARGSVFMKTRRWAWIVGGLTLAQVALGIVALVGGVNLHSGLTHQFGAVALFIAMIHAKHQLAFPAEEKIAA